MFKGLSSATTCSDRQKNHCTVTLDQGLSFDIWLINVTSLMTSKVDCNLLSFLMSFFLFQPTQHPPTTIILVSKWSQESCGSFDTLIKKYVDFRPKNYRSRQCEMFGLKLLYNITYIKWLSNFRTDFRTDIIGGSMSITILKFNRKQLVAFIRGLH